MIHPKCWTYLCLALSGVRHADCKIDWEEQMSNTSPRKPPKGVLGSRRVLKHKASTAESVALTHELTE